MKQDVTPYEKQIFVCTNNRGGQEASCGDCQGEAVFRELRRIAKERQLHPRIRVAQAACLGQCQKGVNVMVYPGDLWYSEVRPGDVAGLVDELLAEGKGC